MKKQTVPAPVNHRRLGLAIGSGLFLDIINKLSPLFILHHAQKFMGLAFFGGAQWMIALFETVQPFIVFGYHNYAMAEISKADCTHQDRRRLFSRVSYLKAIHAVIVASAVIWWLRHSDHHQISTAQIGILILTCASLVLDANWYNLYEHQLARLNFLGGIVRLVSLVGILFFVRDSTDVTWYMLLVLLPNVIISVSAGTFAFRKLGLVREPRHELTKTFYTSAPYSLVVIFLVLSERFDLFLVEHWFGLESLGIYAGPSKVVQSLMSLTGSFVMAFYAENMHANDDASLSRNTQLNLWLLMTVTVPITCGGPFVADEALGLMFPASRGTNVGIFSILSIGLITNVLFTVFGLQILLLRARIRALISSLGGGMLFGLIVAYSLKSALGMHAAAWGIVAAKAFAAVLVMIQARELIGSLPWRAIFKPIFAGLCMAAVLAAIQLTGLIENLVLGGIIYTIITATLNQDKIKIIINHPRFSRIFKR